MKQDGIESIPKAPEKWCEFGYPFFRPLLARSEDGGIEAAVFQPVGRFRNCGDERGDERFGIGHPDEIEAELTMHFRLGPR